MYKSKINKLSRKLIGLKQVDQWVYRAYDLCSCFNVEWPQCKAVLCYVMLCYVMSCYVMVCYVMLCNVMLCYVKL